VPLEAADHIGAGRLIRTHDFPQVLGIEPRRQLGRADQVTEQHGQLAAFGLGRARRGRGRLCGCRGGAALKYRDGVEELAAVPDRRHANGEQILGGQPRQHLGVDMMGAKRLGVILQAQVPQPVRKVHLRRPG
jgi:hypothetical protein